MHTSERYIYLGKGIYIKGITLKHSCSFTQKRFLRHGCPRALQGNWITKKRKYKLPLFDIGRDERIRTSDFLHPMQALYQAELRPDNLFSIYLHTVKCKQKIYFFHLYCNIRRFNRNN